uniref:DUF4283 domain-containing protein n=1 Tax=Setaria digitata TaxID=48799 RepID=A0A915PLZ8_9BILA
MLFSAKEFHEISKCSHLFPSLLAPNKHSYATPLPSLNRKKICFDLDEGRFVDPKIGRNSIYDVEHEHVVVTTSTVAVRRSTEHTWEDWSADTQDVPYALLNICIPIVPSVTLTPLKHVLALGRLVMVFGTLAGDKLVIDVTVLMQQKQGKAKRNEKGKKFVSFKILEGDNSERFSMCKFQVYLKNIVVGRTTPRDFIHRLSDWTLFDWAISFQITIVILYIVSALSVSIVEYLSPWPMTLMAILLLIPIFPVLCSDQHEENLIIFGWVQLTCGYIELFWSSCVILDMHYHSSDWRAYFTLCTVSWQFTSIILISAECPLLEKVVNGQKNQFKVETDRVAAVEPLDETDAQTAKEIYEPIVRKKSDLKTAREQMNQPKEGESGAKGRINESNLDGTDIERGKEVPIKEI